MDYLSPFFILASLAGIVQLIGYWVYVRVSDGHVNTGSWLIWTLSAGIDLVSYLYVTDADWPKNILPAACALACVVTFLYLFVRGRFKMPDRTEWGMVTADSVISLAWWGNLLGVIGANLMLQASTLVSAVPMIRGMLSGKEREDVRPWAIWSTAYICHTAAIGLDLSHWSELAYPIANAIMNISVLGVAIKMRRSES